MIPSTPQSAELVDSLHSLGLTKYEALVYIALISVEGATAADIHAVSKVPRASVYPVLERLVQRNMVLISHTTPRRFNAIPPDVAIRGLMQAIEQDAIVSQKALQDLWNARSSTEQGGQELIWSIMGKEKIIARITDLIEETEKSLRFIAISSIIQGEITEALVSRGSSIHIDTITDHWDGPVLPGMNLIIRKPPRMGDKIKQFLGGGFFLSDQKKVIVVIGSEQEGYTGLYSEAPGFFNFFTMYWNFILQLAPMWEGGENGPSQSP